MCDTAKRAELVKKRVHQMRRRRERHGVYRLCVLCTLLFLFLTGTIGSATGHVRPVIGDMYGSMLLHEDAGGYVLVGVITFAVAVVITTLCIRYKEKLKNNDHHKKEESGE